MQDEGFSCYFAMFVAVAFWRSRLRLQMLLSQHYMSSFSLPPFLHCWYSYKLSILCFCYLQRSPTNHDRGSRRGQLFVRQPNSTFKSDDFRLNSAGKWEMVAHIRTLQMCKQRLKKLKKEEKVLSRTAIPSSHESWWQGNEQMSKMLLAQCRDQQQPNIDIIFEAARTIAVN